MRKLAELPLDGKEIFFHYIAEDDIRKPTGARLFGFSFSFTPTPLSILNETLKNLIRKMIILIEILENSKVDLIVFIAKSV